MRADEGHAPPRTPRRLTLAGGLSAEIHDGAEPVTVWLHHGIGSTRSWDSLLPAAAGGRRALAYDRRGFGGSPRRGAPGVDLFDEGESDLAAVIRALGDAPVHLVGHSDGGTVALLCAARRPDLVRSVTTVSAHVRGDPETIGTLTAMGPPAGWPQPLQRSLQRAHGEDWEEAAGGWHRLWTSAVWRDWSIVEELERISCPLLCVHDRHDRLAPPLHAEALLSACPWTRVVWCESGGHEPHRAEPQRFTNALARLWREAEAG